MGVFQLRAGGWDRRHVFAGTGIAYLEHNCRFTNPVAARDTITTDVDDSQQERQAKHGAG